MKTPTLDFCCCCCDLKFGCCIFVVISLFVAIIGAIFGFVGVCAVLSGGSQGTNITDHSKNYEKPIPKCKIKFNSSNKLVN